MAGEIETRLSIEKLHGGGNGRQVPQRSKKLPWLGLYSPQGAPIGGEIDKIPIAPVVK